jgi:hypothetical protein
MSKDVLQPIERIKVCSCASFDIAGRYLILSPKSMLEVDSPRQ